MARRISVTSRIEDARAKQYLHTLKSRFPRAKLNDVALASLYTIDATLSPAELKKAVGALTNTVIETSSTGKVPAPKSYTYAIEIGFLPGVTDNVGNTAREMLEDALKRRFKDEEAVYSSTALFLTGALSRKQAEAFAAELYNPLIERARVLARGKDLPVVVPKVRLHEEQRADEVDLNVSDEELALIGKSGIKDRDGSRRGPLALSLSAMKVIRDHFKKEGRNPTDIELESLAQTWSEHCKHTIFADPMDDISEGIYRRYIKGATQKIRNGRKGKRGSKGDFCVSVFKDNSGGIVFDEEYLVTHKVETHNSPSALDPFGGAITGIVGVNRDSLGFGLGAKPIANVYGFCVGEPDDATELYRDKEKKQPLLPARRVLEGVVKGVNHGGNQSGIPTPLGFVATDPSYRGKPLVFAGTVGFIPRKKDGRKLYEKRAQPGDYIVMVGGRVGLDGIHGATFSSESLSKGSPATSVQIGDPITQKKLSDAVVREARDAMLYTSITDNGAGGLSSSVGEMAKECGGACVDLEKVPLKYPGLSPWQIWISESQERMTLAVPKKNWKRLKAIFDRHGVEATIIGTFTKEKRCVVTFRGKRIMDMPMAFLHDGRPVERLKTEKVTLKGKEPAKSARSHSESAFLELLRRPNIGSSAFIARQYDHEVQGSSVTKPLQGKGSVTAESAVLQPRPDSKRGIVLSHGYLPWYSALDTYAMAASSIDTAVRNAICAGASLDHLAILDNFCWSTSNDPKRLYQLKEAAKAVYDTALAYGTPYISGKDSMYNDFRGFTEAGEPVHIAALPTLLISAIGVIDDVTRTQTLDLKAAGDIVYLLGETNAELGGSEYFSMLGATGTRVPKTDVKKNKRTYTALERAIQMRLIASATAVGRGGLAAALAKACVAGQLGLRADLSKLPGDAKAPDELLFSESQGRVVVTVRKENAAKFEKLCKGVVVTKIGEVTDGEISLRFKKGGLTLALNDVTDAYRAPFKQW